ncbi:hypothetical protein CRU94_01660 [Arcobacter sp. AHV-9/2010]|uniref:Spy/CpxP family protein refolding chaperone n=1 Tax=Arcobacter sp. AHV-9/2010 TaxID=2021861 RepID=UPI00100B2460|nr:Spy/CpxP family protein refolding chaperone [Arcobacter sp. CECT 9299]RXJ96843.1 hypothetical protein CRU94_01660 [Arcobacter sp. CECT 9299]
MRKIVSSLALASILVSGLYAQQGGANCDFRKDNQNCPINKKDNKMMSKQQSGILGIFYELNLTKDQKTKIDNIIKDSKKNQEFPCDAFSKDSFDKEKFIKIMKDKREKNQELHANTIEKAYKVLDSKQKEQLRTLLDLRKERMKQRFED